MHISDTECILLLPKGNVWHGYILIFDQDINVHNQEAKLHISVTELTDNKLNQTKNGIPNTLNGYNTMSDSGDVILIPIALLETPFVCFDSDTNHREKLFQYQNQSQREVILIPITEEVYFILIWHDNILPSNH